MLNLTDNHRVNFNSIVISTPVHQHWETKPTLYTNDNNFLGYFDHLANFVGDYYHKAVTVNDTIFLEKEICAD